MQLSLALLCWLLLSASQGHSQVPWLDEALRYEGMTEEGNNRGIADRFNKFVAAPLGSPYCASFVSYALHKGNAPLKMRTARSRAFILPTSIRAELVASGKYKVQAGDLAIWIRNGGGHIGIVRSWSETRGRVLEANTSPDSKSGSQWNGGGIYTRTRRYVPGAVFRITHFTPIGG